jgi:hypothetical protein
MRCCDGFNVPEFVQIATVLFCWTFEHIRKMGDGYKWTHLEYLILLLLSPILGITKEIMSRGP